MVKEQKQYCTTLGRTLSHDVGEELQSNSLRINAAVSADRLWNRILSDNDRGRLGGDLEACWRRMGTVGMWMELRGVSAERATVEVAQELGFIDDRTAAWLLREIGEEGSQPVVTDRPVWDAQSGELRWGGQVIRRVRIMANRSSIQLILDAFQAAGWPSRIDDPISQGKHAGQVRQIVLSLNQGLEVIRFRVQEGGRAITWSRI